MELFHVLPVLSQRELLGTAGIIFLSVCGFFFFFVRLVGLFCFVLTDLKS